MGMQVIAENVDTLDDVAWLREIGVDVGQGVALGEPGGPEDHRAADHVVTGVSLRAARPPACAGSDRAPACPASTRP